MGRYAKHKNSNDKFLLQRALGVSVTVNKWFDGYKKQVMLVEAIDYWKYIQFEQVEGILHLNVELNPCYGYLHFSLVQACSEHRYNIVVVNLGVELYQALVISVNVLHSLNIILKLLLNIWGQSRRYFFLDNVWKKIVKITLFENFS